MNNSFIPKILLSSSSKKVPLFLALKKAGLSIHPESEVIAGDINPNSLTFFLADKSWKMPNLDKCNVDELITDCLNFGINIIFPSRDGELLFWSNNANKFRMRGIEVLISSQILSRYVLISLLFQNLDCRKICQLFTSLTAENLETDRFVQERFGSGSKSIGLNLDILRLTNTELSNKSNLSTFIKVKKLVLMHG